MTAPEGAFPCPKAPNHRIAEITAECDENENLAILSVAAAHQATHLSLILTLGLVDVVLLLGHVDRLLFWLGFGFGFVRVWRPEEK